jgi:glutathione synthase/RimK-type ligase-like ATP-grasp enzyme
MANFKIGVAFSKEFTGNNPFGHIGVKLPVYLRLLELCRKEGWEVYVLTRKTYKGNGIFEGGWLFENGKFRKINTPIVADLVYDRSAGIKFPPEGDNDIIWVNRRDFKVLCWDKWKAYQEIGKYMPETFWAKKENDLADILPKMNNGVPQNNSVPHKTKWVVLKPYNGLKGFGVFIGPKEKAVGFKFEKKYKHYIAQEFVDTSDGIDGITNGLHDLRVAIVNAKAVWSHVRVPEKGSFMANAAQGGILTEVDYSEVPESIKKIVGEIAEKFYRDYDNPAYSLDFGIGKDGIPKIFEINDQIGFPRWEMKARDAFLKELVKNFKEKVI